MLLSCLGILAALLISEGIVRLFNLAPQFASLDIVVEGSEFIPVIHPVLRYIPKPGSKDINSFGIRDYPGRSIAKPPGTKRVVVIGDSVGFGFCINGSPLPVKDTIPKILEQNLTDTHGMKVEVWNLSVSGYNAVEESAFFAMKGRELNPDLVVVLNCRNDYYDASFEVLKLSEKDEWKNFMNMRALVLRYSLENSKLAALILSYFAKGAPESNTETASQGLVAKSFKEIQEISNTDKFKVIVVPVPYMDDFSKYDPREINETCQEAANNGFSCFNTLPDLNAAFGSSFEKARCGQNDAIHPSAEAAKVLGNSIASAVIKEL
jgi:hypothetical protein